MQIELVHSILLIAITCKAETNPSRFSQVFNDELREVGIALAAQEGTGAIKFNNPNNVAELKNTVANPSDWAAVAEENDASVDKVLALMHLSIALKEAVNPNFEERGEQQKAAFDLACKSFKYDSEPVSSTTSTTADPNSSFGQQIAQAFTGAFANGLALVFNVEMQKQQFVNASTNQAKILAFAKFCDALNQLFQQPHP